MGKLAISKWHWPRIEADSAEDCDKKCNLLFEEKKTYSRDIEFANADDKDLI